MCLRDSQLTEQLRRPPHLFNRLVPTLATGCIAGLVLVPSALANRRVV